MYSLILREMAKNGYPRHSKDRIQHRIQTGMCKRRSRCYIGLFDMGRMFYVSLSRARVCYSRGNQLTNLMLVNV